MTENGRSRWGFLGGIGGAVLGGLTWVGVAGVTLHDGLVVGSAVLAAVVLWTAAQPCESGEGEKHIRRPFRLRSRGIWE